MNRVGAAVFVLAAALALVSCSATRTATDDSPAEPHGVEGLVEMAEAAHASQAQLDALEHAADDGEMTFETLAALQIDYEDCLIAAGFEVVELPPREIAPGLPAPNSGASQPDTMENDQAILLIGQCADTHNSFATMYYQNQPTSIDLQRAAFEGSREAIVECLRDHGHMVSNDFTFDELYELVEVDLEVNGQDASFEPCYHGDYPEARDRN